MKENNSYRILFVEDDENTGFLLRESLSNKGYSVTLAVNGKEGYRKFREEVYDLCVLDVMMPKLDGFELAARIKSLQPSVPVVFLTSKTMESDKIRGFKAGCDDYITKPFSMMELDYRIQAILKRTARQGEQDASACDIGIFVFYYETRILKGPDGSEKKLTRKEGDLLRLFCERRNTLITRSFLMNHIWGNDDYFISKSMDVYLTRIRSLLKADPNLEISNVYGSGYQLVEKRSKG